MDMQFLLFRAGKDIFAIDAFAIQQIHMPVTVTRLPHVANYMTGIVNIEGEVMPQIDLCKLLRLPSKTNGELLVINIRSQQLALLVDCALEKVAADASQITDFNQQENEYEKNESTDTTFCNENDVSADHVRSELMVNGKTALILNAESLLRLIRAEPVNEDSNGITAHRHSTDAGAQRREDKVGYLTFRLDKETLALPLLQIMEVVEIDHFTHIPGSPFFITGLAVLRAQPLLVVNAATLLELAHDNTADASCAPTSRVLIVQYNDNWIGLLVDQVFGIQYFADSQIIKETSAISFIDSYVIDTTQTIILLLNLQSLLQSRYTDTINQYLPRVEKQAEARQSETVKMLKVLIGKETFAIPIEFVQRITEHKQYAKVDESTKGIIGTVDIDGNIIPVVNLAPQLNIGTVDNLEQWIVISCETEQWALYVSKATALFDLEVDGIDYSASHRHSVKGIANHKGDLVSILDFHWLASGNETV